jgi:hypothetical protein
VFTSPDGTNWTAEGTGIEESGNLKQIAYGDGRYLVVSEYGQHLVSQRTYTSGDEFGQPQLSVSGTGLVSIYAAMPEAERGVFRLDHSTNISHWNEVATDLSPAPDGMLYQGYFPLAPDPAFFRIFAQD